MSSRSSRTPLVLVLLTAACSDGGTTDGRTHNTKDVGTDSTPTVDTSADVDGDGLTLGFEQQVGTADDTADSDGDGCSDSVEILGYFDPLDATDRPYTGGYPRGPRAAESVFEQLAADHGEGFEVGQLNPNWTLTDQNGEVVELRDFYGQVVVVDLSSEWCGPCIDAAPVLDSFYRENLERGFVVLQILLEGVENNSEPVPERWIRGTGVTYPVMVDHSPGDYTVTEVAQYYIDVPGASYDIPSFTLIDRQQRITDLYVLGSLSPDLEPDVSMFREALDVPVPEVETLLPDNAAALRAELGMEEGAWVTPASLCAGG